MPSYVCLCTFAHDFAYTRINWSMNVSLQSCTVSVDYISLSAEIGPCYAMHAIRIVVHLPTNTNPINERKKKKNRWHRSRMYELAQFVAGKLSVQWKFEFCDNDAKTKAFRLWENRCRCSPWAIHIQCIQNSHAKKNK